MDLRLKHFEKISQYVQNYAKTNISGKLSFSKPFVRSGKQGLLGILEYSPNEDTTHELVYKISQYINYLAEHENIIMQCLNSISHFCPNFCHAYGTIDVFINADFRNAKNPFEYKDYKVKAKVLLMEHLKDCKKMYYYIKNDDVGLELVFSQIKQVLSALFIAQKRCKFTSYDLHSNNVLLKECDPNILFLYALDEDNQILIPSYGYQSIIIDFGFGYCKENDGKPLYSSLAHTSVGFMSNMYDEVADTRLFLLTVSHELERYKKNSVTKKFRKMCTSFYEDMRVDLESGWDEEEDDMSASDYVGMLLNDELEKSEFFDRCGHFCIDLIQRLIQLPLRERNYTSLEENFKIFAEEFEKIENEICSNSFLLYIFKRIVDAAAIVKEDYYSGKKTKEAVTHFSRDVFMAIQDVSKFCNPKINYEKMLCSLLLLTRNVEGILYETVERKVTDKEQQKKQIDFRNVEDILSIINYNYRDSYKITEKNVVVVIDNLKQKMYEHKLTATQIQTLNETDEFMRGNVLYQEFISQS